MQINKQLRLAIFVIATASLMVVTLLSFGMYYHFSSQDLEANTKNSLNRSASIVEEKINDIDILTEKVQFFSKSSYDLMTDLRKYAIMRRPIRRRICSIPPKRSRVFSVP